MDLLGMRQNDWGISDNSSHLTLACILSWLEAYLLCMELSECGVLCQPWRVTPAGVRPAKYTLRLTALLPARDFDDELGQ